MKNAFGDNDDEVPGYTLGKRCANDQAKSNFLNNLEDSLATANMSDSSNVTALEDYNMSTISQKLTQDNIW